MKGVHLSLQRPPHCELFSTQPALGFRRLVWILRTLLFMVLDTCFIEEGLLVAELAHKGWTLMYRLMGLQLTLGEELLWALHTLVFFGIRIMFPVMIIQGTLISKVLLADATIKRGLLEMLLLDVIPQMSSVGIRLLANFAREII